MTPGIKTRCSTNWANPQLFVHTLENVCSKANCRVVENAAHFTVALIVLSADAQSRGQFSLLRYRFTTSVIATSLPSGRPPTLKPMFRVPAGSRSLYTLLLCRKTKNPGVFSSRVLGSLSVILLLTDPILRTLACTCIIDTKAWLWPICGHLLGTDVMGECKFHSSINCMCLFISCQVYIYVFGEIPTKLLQCSNFQLNISVKTISF